jgi:hypothetical protein
MATTVVNHKFEIGDEVYLKTDEEQRKRIVVAIKLFKGGELLYDLTQGVITSLHYDFELSPERDQVLKMDQ